MPKPTFTRPIIGQNVSSDADVAALNESLHEIWDLAVVAQTGTPEQEALVDEFRGIRDGTLDAAASADADADRAETARDAAFVNADVYTDTAAGLAAVALGDQFQVASGDEIIRYRHDAGPLAVEVARYPATAVIRNLVEVLGLEELSGTLVTQGATTPNSNDFATGATIVLDETLSDSGVLSAVSVRLAAAGTGEIHVFKPAGTDKWTRTHVIQTTHAAAGVHRFSVDNGLLPPGVEVHAGGMIGYKAITGALRYAAGGQFWQITSASEAVGTICFRSGNNAFTAAISIDVLVDAETVDARLQDLKNADPSGLALQLGYEPQRGVAVVSHGDETPNTFVLSDSIIAPVDVATRSGVLESVSCRLNAGGTLRIEVYEPVGDGTFECVASWPASTPNGGLCTFFAGDGVIPRGFWVKAGGFAALNTLSPLTARGKYATGAGGWISLTGAGGVGAIASRTLSTDGFVVSIAFSYRGPEETIEERLVAMEAQATTAYAQAVLDALLRVGVNYGITPTLAQRKAYALGDSTVAAFSFGTAIMGLIDSVRVEVDLSVPAASIAHQQAAWIAESIVANEVGWVIVQVGLNDLNPAEAASVAIGRLQTLVNTIKGDLAGGGGRLYVSQMIPCRERLIDIYGGTDGPIAYQKWLDINEAIAGGGPTPITNVDGRITAHVPLMDDGSGNLRAEYDTGDGIHPNTAGRQVNATAWENALTAAGLAV